MNQHPLADAGSFPVPDPNQLHSQSRRWSAKADALSQRADRNHKATSNVVNRHWTSSDANRALSQVARLHQRSHHTADVLRDGSQVLATAHHHLSDALHRYREAHALGNEALREEEQHRRSGAALLSNMTSADRADDPGACQQLQAQADGSDGWVSPQRLLSISNGHQALDDAHRTTHTASARLNELAGLLHSSHSQQELIHGAKAKPVNLAGVAAWARANANKRDFDGYPNNDCTDFVSRALHLGGGDPETTKYGFWPIPLNKGALGNWYQPHYDLGKHGASNSWGGAYPLAQHLKDNGSKFLVNGATQDQVPQSGTWPGVKPGDVIFINQDGKPAKNSDAFHGIDHAGIVVGVQNGQILIAQHSSTKGGNDIRPLSKWFNDNQGKSKIWIVEPAPG